MRSPHRVSSKIKLSQALGISPPTLYAFLRLPDSPPPRNGYFYVAAWRRFITKKRTSVRTSEREALQIELLRTKLDRERFVNAEARESTRKRILAELVAQFEAVLYMVKSELFKARTELSPVFEGRDARTIYRLWKNREQVAFRAVVAELEKRTGAKVNGEQPPEKVVQFAVSDAEIQTARNFTNGNSDRSNKGKKNANAKVD